MKRHIKRYIAIFLSLVILLSCAGCSDEGDGHFKLTITQTNIPKLAGINTNKPNIEQPSQNTTEEPNTTEQPGNNNTTETLFDSNYIGRSDGHTLTDKYSDDGVDLMSDEALAEQKKFADLEYESFQEEVVKSTFTLHQHVIHPENYGLEVPEQATFGDLDMSEEAANQMVEDNQNGLKMLKTIDRSLLTKNQKLEYDMLVEGYEHALAGSRFYYYYEPFAYTSGLHSNLPVAFSVYKLYTKGDVDTYLQLLRQTRTYVDSIIEYEELRRQKGFFMSSASADEVIRQCEEFIAKPEENLIIETFDDAITKVEGLSEKEIETYKASNKQAVLDVVIPAYQDIIAYFKEHRNDGTNDLGLCYIEYGKMYYEQLLYNDAGIDMSPEDIIKRLDQGLDDAMSKMYAVAQENYSAYSDYLNEKNHYGDIDPMETEAYFKEVFEKRFPEMPDVSYSTQNVHESLKDIVSPAFYIIPALDDIEHNYIYLNLKGNNNELWSTLAHEGIAGHMYQFCYFLNTNPNPMRALMEYVGYSEGWATYVENMSYGYYKNYAHEEYAALETINNQLDLLLIARMEIGVNYEGWDRAKVSSWLEEKGFSGTNLDGTFTYVTSEPVNYQMYVMGWLTMEDLRAYAEEKLGAAFDEKEFHQTILEAGPTSFPVLQDWVDSWISEKLG
ncbi:MAG: DUF885 domain-containing protein [Lachnospiraceae bacterium]|nr:DUF885 domain-containing protein [Lachnospiraceae bacterium]